VSEASLLERLFPPVDPLGQDGQPKPSRMDRREQLVAIGLGFANIAIAAVMARAIDREQGLALLAGLFASALTLIGGRLGNRLVAMFGLFLSVVTRSSSSTAIFFAFGAPYYGAAFWMFLRYNKLVKAQAVLRRQQRSAKGGAAAPARGRRSDGNGPSATSAKSAKSRPSASKRYTPPKPVKKRPPPPTKPPRDRSIVD